MSAFRLSTIFMKRKELSHSFHDVHENKGVSRLTRNPENSIRQIAGIAFGNIFIMIRIMQGCETTL